MKRDDYEVKVFHIKVKYDDGTEEVQQFDIDKYRKVMALFVTPLIKSNGFVLNGKLVKSIELYKPEPEDLEFCPVLDKKCIRPDGDCQLCFVANELMKDVFGDTN